MLSQTHITELQGSCISEEIYISRGYRTIELSDRDELKELRIPAWAYADDSAFPGLLIPMYRATGEPVSHQFKPAVPQKHGEKTRKYASPAGTPNHLDMHPFSSIHASSADTELWITEGAKKSDCLASLGVCALTLTGVWNWRSKDGTLGDWEDVRLRGRDVVVCFDADARDNRNVMGAMRRLGSWLESKKVRSVGYLIVPEFVDGTPVKGVDDYFAAGGSMGDLRAVISKEVPGDNAKDASFTDTFLSETACEEALQGRYCWSQGLGWMKWDGCKWGSCTEKTVMETMRMWAMDEWRRVMKASIADPNKDFKAAISAWRSVQSVSRLSALMRLACGILEEDPSQFDADPDLLNCPNGVVDLRTGEISKPDPSLLMTKAAGCDYTPGATHPDWDKALEAIPAAVRDWYQLRMGQALTGHMAPDDLLVITQGGGANGKSTVNEATARAAGDYFLLVSDRALMANPDAHPTELMDFMGARYAVLEETPEARRLDPQRLKRTVGTPTITARRIRQDSVTFKATHSLFLSTNHTPSVDETDHGTWRRLALVRFPYTFRKPNERLVSAFDRVGDGALRGRITTDPEIHRAVLAWMVEGAMKWYSMGRAMPEVPDDVDRDTSEWRSKSDPVMGFISEELVFDTESHIESTEMLAAMNTWLESGGYRTWSARLMSARFGGHDSVTSRQVELKLVRRGAGLSTRSIQGPKSDRYKAWIGVRFATDADDTDPEEGNGDSIVDAATCENAPLSTVSTMVRITSSEEVSTRVNLSCVDTVDMILKPLPFDLETCSVTERFRRPDFVRLAGYGDTVTTDVRQAVDALMGADAITGHNVLAFDLIALARHHGADYEALASKTVDTLLVGLHCDPVPAKEKLPAGYHSLDGMAGRLGVEGKTDDVKKLARKYGGFDCIPLDVLGPYLRGDLAASAAVYDAVKGVASDEYVKREHRVQTAMGRITLNGFRVDEELVWDRHQRGQDRLDVIKDRLHRVHGFPARGSAPQRTNAGKEAFRRALMASGLGPKWIEGNWTTNKDGSLSLSKDVLTEKRDFLMERKPAAAELCDAILDMNGVRSIYGNIIDHAVDGRVHPSIMPFQASGRWSIQEPGITVTGKRGGKHIERAVYLPEEGEVLVAFDLDQVDMRAIAAASQDPAYMGLFIPQPGKRVDPHQDVADAVGLSREAAKAIGHGWNYGLGIAGQVRGGVPEELAVKFDRGMREAYPRLIQWQNEVREEAGALPFGEVPPAGDEYRILYNLYGRPMKVHRTRAYTQAAALIGQGTTRDIIAEGILRLPFEVRCMIKAVIHDELVLSIPVDQVEDVSRVMLDAFTFDLRGVPITAGVSPAGTDWSLCYSK